MPMLAEVVDAVVGADTHRDTHEIEIAHPTGAPITTTSIDNDSSGYAELLAWIVDHAPGPRVVVAIEGTRSYGAGLARALTEAGLTVIECEQPSRTARRGRGKSDAIDAHLAVLSALQLDADRLPTPRADGDREALRVLLTARDELTTTGTAQTNRLKALLLVGDDTDRELARGKLTENDLATIVRRKQRRDATREQAVRQASCVGSRWRCARGVASSRKTGPSCRPSSTTSHQGSPTDAGSARSAPPRSSCRSRIPAGAATTPRSPPSAGSARSRPAADKPPVTGSTAAATAP